MDKSRYKRPPDVNEALSSMLWTPYDQTTNISSSSTDSLSDDEREREKRKFNRHSNPLPSSLNWWNSHVPNIHPTSSLRYSFPFYGNCVPSMNNNNSNNVSSDAGMTTTTMVRSFTDDFYQYQHQTTSISQQQQHKYHQSNIYFHYKSQPLLPLNNNKNSGSDVMANEIIDTPHLVSNASTPIITNNSVLPMHFNHQRNNGIWQNNKMMKSGNDAQQAFQCNIVKHSMKTSPSTMNCMVKQISCNRNSKENTPQLQNVGVDYRLLSCNNNNINSINKNRCQNTVQAMDNSITAIAIADIDSDECENVMRFNNVSKNDLYDHCKNNNPQMPFSSSPACKNKNNNYNNPNNKNGNNLHNVQSQKFQIPVSLTNASVESSVVIAIDDINSESKGHEDAAYKCNNSIIDNVVDVNRTNLVECNNQNIISISNNNNNSVDDNTMSDNLIISSAIENSASPSLMMMNDDETPSKAKYSSEIVTLREKRRRNRRDRRLSRTRASNSEILPDILNNPRPPPYSSLPPTISATPQVPSIISTVPIEDTRYLFSLPLVRRSASDRSGKDCCGQWFNGPPLRFLVVLVALGGVACTLGGATLGSIALAGSPTSHLTAGLLMTGVGIVLVTISGIAWRMTTSDAHQCTGRCGRRQCSRGNSSFGLLYPEFQHRPPPPSYQASMQEHRLRIMMLDRERQGNTASTSTATINTSAANSNARASPPPTYHSNVGTLLRPPIQFQREQSHTNNVQIEIPIDNNNSSAVVLDEATTASSSPSCRGYLGHQSPTSSQTITTIASINQTDESCAVLSNCDASSLIRLNNGGGGGDNDIVGIHIALNNGNNNINKHCSRAAAAASSRISNDRSRCKSFSDRHNICIKESHDQQHDVRMCKNVNIGTKLNKALISVSHPTMIDNDDMHVMTLPRNVTTRANFHHHNGCEMEIR